MRLIALIGSALAVLPDTVSGQTDQKGTVCGNQRFGSLNDSLSCQFTQSPAQDPVCTDQCPVDYPNAWNKKSPKSGFVCLKVDNSTPAFDATWNWDKNIQDVHSFPYVRFNHPSLPIRLSNLESIRLSTDWIYTPGNPSRLPRDFSSSKWAENKVQLNSKGVQANAAWDFFLDDDRNRTLYPQVAAVEIMVWLGSVGDPWWLGRANNSIISTVTLGETNL
jgi:xyloglucan-specific endo-beta-1,4-glucanase